MARTWYEPTKDIVGRGTFRSALGGWLDRQRQSREQFTAAEQPLRQAVQMFQPGGGYGRGQKTLLRDESRRAHAEATTRQVASGMSSGSLATGTKLRTERDLAAGLTGVEDVRTQFLNRALEMLSGLRGQQAGLTAQVNDPTFAPYMSYLGQRHGQAAQLQMASGGVSRRTPSRPARLGVSRPAQTRARFSVPRF